MASRREQVLVALRASFDGLSFDVLRARVAPNELPDPLEALMRGMVRNGLVVSVNSRFRLTVKGVKQAVRCEPDALSVAGKKVVAKKSTGKKRVTAKSTPKKNRAVSKKTPAKSVPLIRSVGALSSRAAVNELEKVISQIQGKRPADLSGVVNSLRDVQRGLLRGAA